MDDGRWTSDMSLTWNGKNPPCDFFHLPDLSLIICSFQKIRMSKRAEFVSIELNTKNHSNRNRFDDVLPEELPNSRLTPLPSRGGSLAVQWYSRADLEVTTLILCRKDA